MHPKLPQARGPLSEALVAHLRGDRSLLPRTIPPMDALVDDDLHLALWTCYQLHYGGFDGVDDAAEWDLAVLALRARMEERFERALRGEHDTTVLDPDPVRAIRQIATWAGPPLSSMVEEQGTIDHLREFSIHRSAYQLKEADPHTWGIPRLAGPGRAAMVEIQADEYGGGQPGAAHSELFAAAMEDLDLCSDFGHYLDRLPGVTLATDNLVSLFGLNRRLRGALVGHLALFEMCSVVPMTRYRNAARRVGGLPALEHFYDVHVEVDAHHARLALDSMVALTVEHEPGLAADVIFGAAALARVEARLAGHVLRHWDRSRCSLRPAEDLWSSAPATEVSLLAG